jgi:glutamate dehydrogenase/leucine dehydrogenase
MAGTKNITNEELLTLDCEILVPAALENQITLANANDIKARIVAEAANGPVTPVPTASCSKMAFLTYPTFSQTRAV